MTTSVVLYLITWLLSAHVPAAGHTFQGFLACRSLGIIRLA